MMISISPPFIFVNRLYLLRTVIFFIGVWLLQPLVFATESNSAALKLVEKMRLGDNLGILSYQTILKTHTYLIMANTVGPEKAQFLIKEEIKKTTPKYQHQWNQNLAQSYAEFFTHEELESLSEKHKASPYVNKLFMSQDKVGKSMQARSKNILHSVIFDVLSNTFSKVVPKGN